MTKEALKLALDDIVKIPTLTAGLLVKLIDVEAIINEALAQPAQDWKTTPKKNAPLVEWAKNQTPPQRKWVGLTDEECDEAIKRSGLWKLACTIPQNLALLRGLCREAAHNIGESK